MVVPSLPVTSKSAISVAHVAAWVQSIGGVETLLRHHRQCDAPAGLAAAQIALFDKTEIPNEPAYSTQRFSGWFTPRRMRQDLRETFSRMPESVVLWHNGWGLPWFADGDHSRRRIVCWWDSQTHWGPWLDAVKPWVDGVICMSESAAEEVGSLWPELPAERRGVMRVPIEPPSDLGARSDRGREWVIGCAGRLVRAQKRADRLVPFVTALKELGVPFRIEVISDGPLRESLQQELKDESGVQFLGWQSSDDYWRRMQGWDAMVSFTDHEGGPIVMLEAMAAGALPVFPSIGGSLVADYLPGLDFNCLYPPGEVATAAARMHAFMTMPAGELLRLRQRAQQIAQAHTVDRYHREFTSFVERIDQLPRISQPPQHQRGTKLADFCPLGALTRFSRGSLWK